MKNRVQISVEFIRESLSYDPETGVLTRISTGIPVTERSYGYVVFRFTQNGMQHRVMAHRAAYALMTGEWPNTEIDHRNGVRDDNRWENLRAATRPQNSWNKGPHRDNSTGYKGVHKHSQNPNTWCAQIMVNGKRKCLGSFRSPEDAHKAYCKAAKELHNEFARTS